MTLGLCSMIIVKNHEEVYDLNFTKYIFEMTIFIKFQKNYLQNFNYDF